MPLSSDTDPVGGHIGWVQRFPLNPYVSFSIAITVIVYC
ncbi:hypothetical protein VHA_001196 [Grimontia hollisae CIP 101886]|uniref:Uncharacterized protein n=1 Tax=Grimontia hollisae CIP 101886 TaxID=675812 RepID=D0I629_GRIHO|nr:hypothetical protein VHA_001196 [Grimontia hollisae CIP 101886]